MLSGRVLLARFCLAPQTSLLTCFAECSVLGKYSGSCQHTIEGGIDLCSSMWATDATFAQYGIGDLADSMHYVCV